MFPGSLRRECQHFRHGPRNHFADCRHLIGSFVGNAGECSGDHRGRNGRQRRDRSFCKAHRRTPRSLPRNVHDSGRHADRKQRYDFGGRNSAGKQHSDLQRWFKNYRPVVSFSRGRMFSGPALFASSSLPNLYIVCCLISVDPLVVT